MSNLYEFGGLATVTLKTKVPVTIGDKQYEAGEPYFVIDDVEVSFDYEATTSTVAAKKPIYEGQEAFPKAVVLSKVSMQTKIYDLIFSKTESETFVRTQKEILIARGGKIVLPQKPRNFESLFVYIADIAQSKVDRSTIQLTDNVLSGDFVDGQKYFVFFEIEEGGYAYDLAAPHFPYFSMEIELKGNINKVPGCGYIYLDAVSLLATPNLDIAITSIENTKLKFSIIYTNQKKPYFGLQKR